MLPRLAARGLMEQGYRGIAVRDSLKDAETKTRQDRPAQREDQPTHSGQTSEVP